MIATSVTPDLPRRPVVAGLVRSDTNAAAATAVRPPASSTQDVVLADGRVVTLAALTPGARPLIERAIANVSAESSRRRFFTVRHRLSDAELDALTTPDGWHRYAIGASARDASGAVEGIGVARFARRADDPSAAEAAVLVVDAWQRRGIGTALLRRLADAARERGIARLTGLVLADNDPMLALLARHAPGARRRVEPEHVEVDVPLSAALAAR